MYVPAHFAITAEETAQLLAAITVVDLIGTGPDGLMATFLPVRYEPDGGPLGSLQGHV
ncbi:MAG: Negative transcriptional regulator, PaiB family, partial [Frankiales bacterium]|nr:Negative transcriptional regulator, PaiB family [Frankiales bacterium]